MSLLKQSFKTIGSLFVFPCGSEMFTLCLYMLYSTFDKHTIKTEVSRSIFKMPLVI